MKPTLPSRVLIRTAHPARTAARCTVLLALLALTALGCRRAEVAPATGPTNSAPTTAAASSPGGLVAASKISVRLVAPEKVLFRPSITATGNLKPLQSAGLAFPVPGTLAVVRVKRGQEVAADAVLAELDAAAARAGVSQAQAGVAAATAQLRLAEDAFGRMSSIRKEEGISEAQLLQSEAQRDAAAAQLLGAKAQQEQAQVYLRNHTLRAPFAGVVIRVPDGIGFAVSPAVQLFALESTQSLILETSVTQEDAADLRLAMVAQVTVPATGVTTPEPDATGKGADAQKARIRIIVPSVDAATNRVPIEIEVPNPDGRFKPHAFARAVLASVEHEAWRLPASTLTQNEGSFAAWIAGPDGKAHATRVRVLGDENGQAVVVPSGEAWKTDLRLVEAPPLGLSDGAELAVAVSR